ncbi:family 43 glycosylhydrolase [Spirillospora sp. NPDC127200]
MRGKPGVWSRQAWFPVVAGAAICSLVALVAAVFLPSGEPRPAPGPTGAPASASPPVPAPAGTATPLAAPGYSPLKPVVPGGFADPMVLKVGEVYYAYGTNNGAATLPVATAPAPTGPWTASPGDGLARLPSWAVGGWTWAPEVVPPLRDGDPYLLYFSARAREGNVQCVGVATAVSPAGPFTPREGGPLVCPRDLGGAIDPASYVEADGARYLLYKSDARKTAAIYLVRMAPDGLATAGPPKRLLGRDADEPVLVEAPDLVRRGDRYVLFYSAGWYFQPNYQTRYATASSLEGPYTKAGEPLQSTGGYGGKIVGPGSADLFSGGDGDHLVFHGIVKRHGGSKVDRAMYVAALGWDGSRPVLRGVPVRYEAERGRTNGCVGTLKRPKASADGAVGPFDRDGCRYELPVFAPAAGRYEVRTGYANRSGGASLLELSVNGRAAASVPMRATSGDDWESTTTSVDLAAGWNTLGLRRLQGQGQVDYMELR